MYSARIAQASGKGTWQAAAWWLERRRSGDYARRSQVEFAFDAEVRKVAEAMGTDADALVAEAERIVTKLEG